ncbi:conserved hypothetical protein, partial [Ricinus communis]
MTMNRARRNMLGMPCWGCRTVAGGGAAPAGPGTRRHRRGSGVRAGEPVRIGDPRRAGLLFVPVRPALHRARWPAGQARRPGYVVPHRVDFQDDDDARADASARRRQGQSGRRRLRLPRFYVAQSDLPRPGHYLAPPAHTHVLAARRCRLFVGRGHCAEGRHRRSDVRGERGPGRVLHVLQPRLGRDRHRDGTGNRRTLRPPDAAPADRAAGFAGRLSPFGTTTFGAGQSGNAVPQAHRRQGSVGSGRAVDRPGRRLQRQTASCHRPLRHRYQCHTVQSDGRPAHQCARHGRCDAQAHGGWTASVETRDA